MTGDAVPPVATTWQFRLAALAFPFRRDPMPKSPLPRPSSAALADLGRFIAAALALLMLACAGAAAAEDAPLRVAVYDVPPYGRSSRMARSTG